MELVQELVQNQVVYIPVLLVIFLAVLVFVFGFQTVKEPPFIKLISEDKKQLNKKRKIKEKKPTANGNVVIGQSKQEKSPLKESKRSPQKDTETQKPKDKKVELNNKVVEKNKKNEASKVKVADDVKSKKNAKKTVLNEKPADFDEGNWETVPAKGDKKKKQESPIKKEKKIKKSDKPTELEKVEKDSVNKELQTETEKEVSVEKVIEEVKTTGEVENSEEIKKTEDPVLIIEDKKEKKKEKKQKKEKEIPKQVQSVTVPEINIVQEVIKDIGESKHAKEVKSTTKTSPVELIKEDDAALENKASHNPNKLEGGVAFDELGDVWTEAKIPKKSKKKARKDN
ncbi:hypothetical protein WA026_017473 [Henosepilachna vigintioctopunctata]|uniref:Uncharacterized protein n=1 Tax=Henosepilachna vigintioctopunctata TaxID=420089 RepID=A0AAW1VGZ5_9CUCU